MVVGALIGDHRRRTRSRATPCAPRRAVAIASCPTPSGPSWPCRTVRAAR